MGRHDDDTAEWGYHYDAAQAPKPGWWLRTDEQERMILVEAHHRRLPVHPDLPSPRRHAIMHVIVENQVAGGEPPEVGAAIARLVAAGLTRHEAVHAAGSVVADRVWEALHNQRSFDREAVVRALAELQPERWAGTVP